MGAIGQNFYVLSSVDSTNNYAMAQVQNGAAKHGDTYFTYEQTAGRGQRNKKWVATAGENIIMSIVLYPGHLALADQPLLGMSVALSCCEFVQRYAIENITIKWPNDIYWNDRKAGGILIENGVQGNHWQYAVVGIGINVNQVSFPEGVKNPVSLKQILGKSLDILVLATELCILLESGFRDIESGREAAVFSRYNQALYKREQTVKLKRGNILFPAVIKGADMQGRLLAQSGILQSFQAGEIEWMV